MIVVDAIFVLFVSSTITSVSSLYLYDDVVDVTSFSALDVDEKTCSSLSLSLSALDVVEVTSLSVEGFKTKL